MASKSNKTAADIRESHFRQRLPIAIAARLPEMKALCAEWHNRFGACLTLDRPRLNALTARLVDGHWTADAVLAAIEGYHAHVTTDDWHKANPKAIRTFSSFLTCEQFERHAQDGLAARIAAERTAQAAQAKLDQAAAAKAAEDGYARIKSELLALWDSLDKVRQDELLAQALLKLPPAYRNDLLYRVRKTEAVVDMSNRLVRAEVFALLKNESAQSADRKDFS